MNKLRQMKNLSFRHTAGASYSVSFSIQIIFILKLGSSEIKTALNFVVAIMDSMTALTLSHDLQPTFLYLS